MKSEKEKAEAEEHRDERIEKTGQITLQDHVGEQKIHLLTIIGEVEGHENLAGNSKTTKYEHILPQLAAIEDSEEIGGGRQRFCSQELTNRGYCGLIVEFFRLCRK